MKEHKVYYITDEQLEMLEVSAESCFLDTAYNIGNFQRQLKDQQLRITVVVHEKE